MHFEDGLLPENARLQLRRNELFFAVNQRERNARTAALFEGTSARLGAKIPSFLARTKILKLKKSNVHGWGVFAGEPIYRDEFIVEYASSMVNDALANFREWQYMQSLGGKTYFFKLKNSCIVDATHSGGVTRFINHSCRPNCRTQDVSNVSVQCGLPESTLANVKRRYRMTPCCGYTLESTTNLGIGFACVPRRILLILQVLRQHSWKTRLIMLRESSVEREFVNSAAL
eukprot:XP_028344086.1 histone-lysine N-methyltransferase ATXR7-like [Physeter catodon]